MKPITDYHGTEVTVELVYKSAGVFVYLELESAHDRGSEFARLTPEQARELAGQLVRTAEEAP